MTGPARPRKAGVVNLARRVVLLVLLAGPAAIESACGHDPPAAVATHVCPMHPNRTGGAGDKCSDCGMDLVPK